MKQVRTESTRGWCSASRSADRKSSSVASAGRTTGPCETSKPLAVADCAAIEPSECAFARMARRLPRGSGWETASCAMSNSLWTSGARITPAWLSIESKASCGIEVVRVR